MTTPNDNISERKTNRDAVAKPNLTAVVVDDNEEERCKIAAILTRLGMKVVARCSNGTIGLAAIRWFRPAIAVIDNQMGGMNGIDVIRALVAEGTETKLIMCSGTAQKQMQQSALSAGAVYFVVKPYDKILTARELRTVLAEVLDG